uniref:Bushy growth protein n=1 Tax=Rhizophora mucronata TaxID=61149 RepID=A0A2P2L8N7_RHIMU
MQIAQSIQVFLKSPIFFCKFYFYFFNVFLWEGLFLRSCLGKA